MKNIFLLVLLVASVNLFAQPAPPSAEAVLGEATLLARKENKKVFIIFHASWCGWCHKMDTAMNDPVCKKFFDDNFVIRHLVVNESKDKRHLENPGADAFKTRYYGKDQGIPYWLLFDQEGKFIADSKYRKPGETAEQGENSGCPATAEEVEYFVSVLEKNTSLNKDELDVIRKRFRRNDN